MSLPEIQKIVNKPDTVYIIDKILKVRKQRGKTDYFVKWRGYGDEFNQWVSEIINIGNDKKP